jgi:hypothetical protein
MTTQTLKNSLNVYWVLFIAYDILFGESVSTGILFMSSWIGTYYLIDRWDPESPDSYLIKVVTVAASATAVAIVYAAYTELTWNIVPNGLPLYQLVASILLQGMCASVFAGLLVAIPLGVTFRQDLLPAVILACLPVMAIQTEGVFTAETTTTKFLMSFEIVFLPIAVWHVTRWWQELRGRSENCVVGNSPSFGF